jgi:hypothetical protein
VIGNGDVFTPEDAVRMFQQTGCDAVMIGRAASSNPWIFRQIEQYVTTGRYDEPSELDRYHVIRDYYKMLMEKPDKISGDVCGKMKQFATYFSRGVRNGSQLRKRVYQCHAEHMMPAAVAVCQIGVGIAVGNRVLCEAGERIVFAQNADNRFAFTEVCCERGGNPRHAAFDFHSGRFEHVGQQLGGFGFLIPRLRPVPDLQGRVPVLLIMLVDVLRERRFLCGTRSSKNQNQQSISYNSGPKHGASLKEVSCEAFLEMSYR